MFGTLTGIEIEALIHREFIGRIGCHAEDVTYVVPISYVYDGEYVYGHSFEGMKVNMMRKNPKLCFEVDDMHNMANWQSVIITGAFHELKGKEAGKARDYLFEHVLPLMTSSTIHPHEHQVTGKIDDSNRIKPVMYKIKIKEKSGRFEKQ